MSRRKYIFIPTTFAITGTNQWGKPVWAAAQSAEETLKLFREFGGVDIGRFGPVATKEERRESWLSRKLRSLRGR